ncbi:hypothetical protein [Streptomyces ipomoeae]|uniref:hypothetical protein n=1 Tax=Streptomyces ipomoeae TaxID=103232 RepID=UPI0015F09A4B|nr:hypothetical protein [Streptomyces ipomoeae]
MGSEYFSAYQDGTDVKQAFRDAVENAEYEYGHGGYTGTIAEKDSYKVVTETPMPLEEAEEYAATLANANNSPVDDKWGPAGAIPVLTDRRRVRVTIPERPDHPFGYKNLEEAAIAGLKAAGDLKEGEKPVYCITGIYQTHPRTGRPVSGELDVPLEGGPLEHRGWLFFGFASY